MKEIRFPDPGVGCTLAPAQQAFAVKATSQFHAFSSKAPRNDFDGEEGPSRLEEIEAPRALAERSARQESEK